MLTAELVTPPSLDPAFVLNSDGTFNYTHDGSEVLSDSFTYQACDDGTPPLCSSSPATVTITVDNVNDAPVIEGQQDLSIPEETAKLITLADLLVTDVDSDPASFILSVQDGTNYTRVGNTITPIKDFNGDLTVPVTVSDGTADSDVFNLVVTVTPVNDAPVLDAIGAKAVQQLSTLTFTATASGLPTFPNPGFSIALSGGPTVTGEALVIAPSLLGVPMPFGAADCLLWLDPASGIAIVPGSAGMVPLPIPPLRGGHCVTVPVQGLAIDTQINQLVLTNALLLTFGK